jgi:hypothetical protein
MMKRHFHLLAAGVLLASALPAAAQTPHDPLVITGAGEDFVVADGAAALGCAAGTVVFANAGRPPACAGNSLPC